MSTEAKEETKVPEEAKEAPKGDPKQEAAVPAQEKETVELSETATTLIDSIEKMSVLELSQLVKALEDKFGVTAAVPVAAAGGGGGDAAPAEEKDSFDVVLAEVGGNKIQVIKALREVTTLGLKEAKDLADSAPKPVKNGAPKDEANAIKEKLEAAGAKVELK